MVKILGLNIELNKKDKEQQKTKFKITEEAGIMGVRKHRYESILKGLTPARLARILEDTLDGNTQEYLTLAEEMEERDTHYRAVLNTRKQGVLALPILIKEVKNPNVFEFIEKIVETNKFNSLCFDLLDAIGKGYSVVEIEYGFDGKFYSPTGFESKPPQWFKFKEGELFLRGEGEKLSKLPQNKVIIHQPTLKTGQPIRGGLARLVATVFILKNFGLKDWAAFLEVFGMPIRLGKYGMDASDEEKQTLKSAIASLGTDTGAIIPESMQIEFVNGITAGNSELFENYLRYLDEQISKAVLGQTMTTDNGSSKSQAEVHNSVRKDILKADAKSLAEAINTQLIKPLIDINFGIQEEYPYIVFDAEDEADKALYSGIIKDLATLGFEFSKQDIREKLDLKEPDSADDTFRYNGSNSVAKNKALNFTKGDVMAEEEETEDFITKNWQKIMNPMVDSIEKAIDQKTTLKEFAEGLDTLTLNTSQMEELSTEEATKSYINGFNKGGENE